MFCLERLVLFVSLLVNLAQSSLLYTSFERAIHELEFVRIFYVLHLYLLSLIVLLIVLHLYLLSLLIFAPSASLRSFEVGNIALVLPLYLLENDGGFVI